MTVQEMLARKVGPFPVAVYGAIGVGGLAWWIHRRQASAPAPANPGTNSNVGSASNVANMFALAYPMPYSSDVFVNVTNPPAQINTPINITNPITPPTSAPPPAPLPSPPSAPAPPVALPPPAPKKTSVTYVVQRGDTLWSIAQRFLGGGSRYPAIYQANASMIEAIARQHGFSSSGGGHWIFPGEKLTIPVG